MASPKENRAPGKCPALTWPSVSDSPNEQVENAKCSGLEARDFKMDEVGSSIADPLLSQTRIGVDKKSLTTVVGPLLATIVLQSPQEQP